MREESLYRNKLNELLNSQDICKENKDLMKEFFQKHEILLKRKNGLSELDKNCYDTLYKYCTLLRNVNTWFNNKPFKNLTREDIEKVYNDLEDGKIKTFFGKPYKDKITYYNKVLKSKFFDMAGKSELAREIINASGTKSRDGEVRFIEEKTVREIIEVAYSQEHKLLIWLAFDIGENINALLKLRKKDCIRLSNKDTNEPEYRVNLRKETLKRSRKARSEITNYSETTELLDKHLANLKENDELFQFSYGNAKQILDRAVRITNAKCIPKGEKVTWKDLRSSMACDLLNKGWHTDEINRRLGHTPSSDEIDRYVNFLAVDTARPKKKLKEYEINRLKADIEEMRSKEKMQLRRYEEQIKINKELEDKLTKLSDDLTPLLLLPGIKDKYIELKRKKIKP